MPIEVPTTALVNGIIQTIRMINGTLLKALTTTEVIW
jgi:hypothetical protein